MVSRRSNQLEIGARIESIALVLLEQCTNMFANEKAVKLGKQRGKGLIMLSQLLTSSAQNLSGGGTLKK